MGCTNMSSASSINLCGSVSNSFLTIELAYIDFIPFQLCFLIWLIRAKGDHRKEGGFLIRIYGSTIKPLDDCDVLISTSLSFLAAVKWRIVFARLIPRKSCCVTAVLPVKSTLRTNLCAFWCGHFKFLNNNEGRMLGADSAYITT